MTITNEINTEKISLEGPINSLEEISAMITKVCIKIKNFTDKKSNGKRIMKPHPVQLITIIRICDEILNGKGAIAQVKTGEGKSFIIAVIAIVLALHNRIIDIVTSNLELAIRDEKDQRDYYKLFNIQSGVLCEKNGDADFLKLLKSQIGKDNQIGSGYNVDVFKKPIVYSTNYNFEFAYLHSLFSSNKIRERPYDVVIVDEVDNMFLDQSTSPAIIAQGIKVLYHRDILEIINAPSLTDADVTWCPRFVHVASASGVFHSTFPAPATQAASRPTHKRHFFMALVYQTPRRWATIARQRAWTRSFRA